MNRAEQALFSAACAALLSSGALLAAQDDTYDDVYLSSLPPEGPGNLRAGGEVDVVIDVPGYTPIEFRALAIELPGLPHSRYVNDGATGLSFALIGDPGNQLAVIPEVGVFAPAQWDASSDFYLSYPTGCTISAKQTPSLGDDAIVSGLTQGPVGQPPPSPTSVSIVERKDGTTAIRFETTHSSECWVHYLQFFSQKITYTTAGGGGGVCPFDPRGSGNNEQPAKPDGSRVYSDSQSPTGEYPDAQTSPTGPNSSSTSIEDQPKIPKLEALVASIQAYPNVGQITSLTYEMQGTSYAMETCIPFPTREVSRIEWHFKRTWTFPAGGGAPIPGPIEWGGPNNDPCPSSTGFTNGLPDLRWDPPPTMSADHAAALAGYLQQNYTGSQTPPW